MTPRIILVIGTLGTKGIELGDIRDPIAARGPPAGRRQVPAP